MEKTVIIISLGFTLLFGGCNSGGQAKIDSNTNESGRVVKLTNETFKQLVFDYELNKEWKYIGNIPAIIDFYVSWCGPCRQLSPRIEELAKEYAGKIVVYKVDTDVEKVLSQNMGIRNLPTLIFIPVNGQPQSTMGLLPKETLVKAINEVLLVK
ncbi:MAG: thiol reductase thioredoxin [Bacteroidales bacterium]|nr:thiol reductase thioredoxin [Bacteroidales bacterium]